MENEAASMDEFLCKLMIKSNDLSVFYKMSFNNGEMVATLKKFIPPQHGQNIVIWGLHKSTKLEDVLRFALQAGQVFEVRLHLSEVSTGTENSYCSITYVLTDVAKQAFKRLNGTSLNDRIVVTKLAEGMRLELRTVVSHMDINDSPPPDLLPRFDFEASSFATAEEQIMENPTAYDIPPNTNFNPEDQWFYPLISPVHYPYMFYDDVYDDDFSYACPRQVHGDTLQGSDEAYTCPYDMEFPNVPWSKTTMKWEYGDTSIREWGWPNSEGTKVSTKNPFLERNYNFGQLPYAVPDPTYLINWEFGDFTKRKCYGCGYCGFLMSPYF